MSRVAEKIPGWVERLLIPTLESKVRSIVTEELAKFEKTTDARFSAVDAKLDAMEARLNARLDVMGARMESMDDKVDSLEKMFPTVQEIAEIRARLNQIEKAGR